MLTRSFILALCLTLGAVVIGRAARSEPIPVRESLGSFPLQIAHWNGQPTERFDERVLAVLGVDDYVNRLYTAGGGSVVGLYIGYYRSQRQGDTIHSPLNCLPGAGWQPLDKQRVGLPVQEAPSANGDGARRTITVNRLTIGKGLEKQVVLYWYQSHGRVVASEYWSRAYNLVDAVRLNRTDAAIVRIIAPVGTPDDAAERAAVQAATQFAQGVYPLLARYLPE